MGMHDRVCGNRAEKISDVSFKAMALVMKLFALFSPRDKLLDGFEISPGDTVIDYGCGPGLYVRRTAEMVGVEGTVYPADIHELAVESVKKIVRKQGLKNVVPVLIDGYQCPVPDATADVIFALDMFHMVKEPQTLLMELHRLLKKDGCLMIDPGHQPLENARRQIEESGIWQIASQTKRLLKCVPLKVQ